MKSLTHIYHLKIKKILQTCILELSWGKAQNLTVKIDYPPALTQHYQQWQQAYLNFYQSSQMRGRAINGGTAPLIIDWRAELVKTETKLMYEFHRWLRSGELYEIRRQIASTSQQLVKTHPTTTQTIQIFLTCDSIELERFPWEAWELGTEFATTKAIQIIRAPLNISTENGAEQNTPRQRRARILAILGDDTGLNFEADQQAVRSLEHIAEVKFVGWQPKQTPAIVIKHICDAIASPQGWDVLFFAGHSNETPLTKGELGIAPGVSISIKEITPELIAAKKRGLQVAIFNSCSGLNIASALIDIGFSQVVVMREPIHNSVAQEFLVRFLQGLSQHLNIYDAILASRQYLRMEKSHTYPSAYLVPSLFCHPGATLFHIPPFQWKQRLRQSLPRWHEAIALLMCLILSGIPQLQEFLLDKRILTQALYRHLTTQIPTQKTPPVALVQIDTDSLSRARIDQFQPLDRSYLAKIIHRLRELNASVVGMDIVLDSPQKEPLGDKDLASALRTAVNQNNTWFTFASILKSNRELGVNEATGIASLTWSLQGFIDATDQTLVELPDQDCHRTCPIAYLLSLVQIAHQEMPDLPKPHTNNQSDLRTQILDFIQYKPPHQGRIPYLLNLRLPFDIQPLVDFSLPPERVYELIPAAKLLESSDIKNFSQQVVLIAVGDDERLGMGPGQPDRYPIPLAMSYWNKKQSWLTGGESLAYMIHHFITSRLVIPIPDAWLILIACVLGKGMGLLLERQSFCQNQRIQMTAIIVGTTGVYGVVGLQLYIWAAVLLPWFLPSSIYIAYVLPVLWRKKDV